MRYIKTFESFNYGDYKLEWWGEYERDLFLRYDDIKKSNILDNYEAALLIASDNILFDEIDNYKSQNIPLPKESEKRLLEILIKVKPVDKVFYRGVEKENYDDNHIMGVQSWSINENTAKLFGNIIYKTIKPSKGVCISDIYYWNGLINDNSNGLGDIQAEWFLLNPKKILISY